MKLVNREYRIDYLNYDYFCGHLNGHLKGCLIGKKCIECNIFFTFNWRYITNTKNHPYIYKCKHSTTGHDTTGYDTIGHNTTKGLPEKYAYTSGLNYQYGYKKN